MAATRSRKRPAAPDLPEMWEQQPGETDRNFAAFRHYRDTDPIERSVAATAAALGVTRGVIDTLRTRHAWVIRAGAWDKHTDRARQAAVLREIEKSARQDVALTQRAKARLAEALKDDLMWARMKPEHVARLMEATFKWERAALGTLHDPELAARRGDLAGTTTADLGDPLRAMGANPELIDAATRALTAIADAGRGDDAAG